LANIFKIAVVVWIAASCVANAEPLFVSIARDLGIQHRYTGGWEHFVGGGVATFDCNGDLLPELYIAGGESPAALLLNKSVRGNDILYIEATPEPLALTGVVGAYPLDVDADGIQDLFILRVGANQLLKGGADCSFAQFDAIGFEGGDRWTTAFSATWEGENSLPTLAVGNYVDRNDPDGPFEACDTNFLLRPNGNAYANATKISPGYCPLSMLFSDWGRNGRQDLRVSNDRHYYVFNGEEQLWAMEDTPRLFNAADGWRDYSIWGMGIASRDISGDGIPEVFLTSMADQKLQRLDPATTGPSFSDATYDNGTTAHRPYAGGDGRPSTGWHVGFGDVNNDGRDDIFIAKGNVDQMPSSAMDDPNNLLIQQPNGQFVETGSEAQLASMAKARGAALVDLNLDGLLDIVVVNREADLEIYQNISDISGNWLLLNLHQSGPNPQAVGAWIEIAANGKTIYREITIGGGHASGAAGFEHFGLGPANDIKLRIVWPNGPASGWQNISVNTAFQIERKGSEFAILPR
jgi:hypothetical protein